MASYRGLGSSSVKLAGLGFDPIEVMVRSYQKMLVEIELQERMALGEEIRFNKDKTPKAYNVEFHMNLVERAGLLAEKLLKFGYAPVKEAEDTNPLPVLRIQLNNEGDVFTLNQKDDADD